MINLKKTYSQKKLPWGKEKLGTSDLEIEDYGCLITNLTNIANYFEKEITPSEINKKLIEKGGFNGANYIWGGLTKIFRDITEKYTRTSAKLKDEQIAEIKSAIDSGSPVMIWIDYNPATVKNDMHWVLIIDYDCNDENNFTILDPIDGQTRSLKEYLKFLIGTARRTIEAFVIYKNSEQTKTTETLTNEVEKLKTKINDAINILNN